MSSQTWKARVGALVGGTLLAAALAGVVPAGVAATTCHATGTTDRDGTPLTARLVNPKGTVSGRVDATGCDVGVYYGTGRGRVASANLYGARYYGILVDGNEHDVKVDVVGSTVHDIGDAPITAARHGQGIAFRSFGAGSATGSATGNRVWAYQEAGLNATGPGVTVTFGTNRVIGRGPIDVLSQNGIQVIFGAHGRVIGNRIENHQFLGPNTGNGVLVVGGPAYTGPRCPSGGACPYTLGTWIEGNTITAADVGVAVFEADEDFNPPASPTGITIKGNAIRNGGLSNLYGWSDDPPLGYQAGISDYATGDRITRNVISGSGYDQDACGSAAICLPIDTDGSVDPIVSGNTVH